MSSVSAIPSWLVLQGIEVACHASDLGGFGVVHLPIGQQTGDAGRSDSKPNLLST